MFEVKITFIDTLEGRATKRQLLARLDQLRVSNIVESYVDGVHGSVDQNDALASSDGEIDFDQDDTFPTIVYCMTCDEVSWIDAELDTFRNTIEPESFRWESRELSINETQNPWSDHTRFSTDLFLIGTNLVEETASQHRYKISLQSGVAFGNGQHASTLAILRKLESLTFGSSTRVLDIGTGNGVLLIAAWLLGARSLVGTDLTEDIVAEAKANWAHSQVLAQAFVSDQVDQRWGAFDIILANIPVAALRPLVPGILTVSHPTTRFIFAGFTSSDGRSFLKELKSMGFDDLGVETGELDANRKSQEVSDVQGWTALLLRRRCP